METLSGKLNPADHASRGLDAEALVNAPEWFDGPGFLSAEESAWPAQPTVSAVSDDDVEVKPARKQVHCAQVSGSLDKLLNYYGTWTRLRRGVAYIIRFCQWLLSRRTPQSPKLSHEDISNATDLIIRHAQQQAYPEEWAAVTAGKPVSTSSSVASLCPVLRGGVLCVGGRLARAGALSCDERHPAILPKRHHVSELIMRYYHERTAHAGREQTLAESRRQFWIVNGRALAKDIVRHCTSCRRINATPLSQQMAPLPEARVTAYQPPFSQTGVDFFGPLYVKHGRGTAKRWGCLFTCLATRAVHLEVAPSLETDDFIMVLRQFVNRRGPPDVLFSDNGTNFVGAVRELRDAQAQWRLQQIEERLQQDNIKWVFQPPAAPHMSGV